MIYYTGDIHGGKYEIVRFAKRMNLTADDVIVILGDVGASYYGNERDDALKCALWDNDKIPSCIDVTTDTLNAHLKEVDQQAEEMFFQLVNQFKAAEGITAQLKASYQMEWVQSMNNIRQRVTEIINNELLLRK